MYKYPMNTHEAPANVSYGVPGSSILVEETDGSSRTPVQ
jgi:hypothetical protein